MTPQTRWFSVCARYPQRVDAALMAVSRRTQHVVVAMAVLLCAVVGLHDVPSAYVDFSGWPVLSHIQHRGSYGSDTLSDMYVAQASDSTGRSWDWPSCSSCRPRSTA
jgi:hypothetical protein